MNAEGQLQTSWVWEGSPLEKLRRVSEKLAKRYLWQSAQATMFVLTGNIPARPPLRVSYEWKAAGVGGKALKASQGMVTLEVAPWVSAKTVDRAYRTAQKCILRRHNRSIKEKNLRLFRFVTERLEPTGLFEGGEPRYPPGEEGMIEDELIAYGAYEKRPTAESWCESGMRNRGSGPTSGPTTGIHEHSGAIITRQESGLHTRRPHSSEA